MSSSRAGVLASGADVRSLEDAFQLASRDGITAASRWTAALLSRWGPNIVWAAEDYAPSV